jgi:DNA-directed RNA polymerase beta' subunit
MLLSAGHFGHINLQRPVFFPFLVDRTIKALLGFCINCHQPQTRKAVSYLYEAGKELDPH